MGTWAKSGKAKHKNKITEARKVRTGKRVGRNIIYLLMLVKGSNMVPLKFEKISRHSRVLLLMADVARSNDAGAGARFISIQ
jgi:hypothetical protein